MPRSLRSNGSLLTAAMLGTSLVVGSAMTVAATNRNLHRTPPTAWPCVFEARTKDECPSRFYTSLSADPDGSDEC